MGSPVILSVLLVIFFLVFLSREYFTYKKNLAVKYFLTPLITVTVCMVALTAVGEMGFSAYRALIIVSLIFALAADTMLMVVEVDLLKYGLVYFLTGHIFYVGAFSVDYFFKPWNIALAAIIIAFLAAYFLRLRKNTGSLTVPVLIYLMIVSLMLFFAVSGLNYGVDRPKLFIAAGAFLFVLSDAVLAYNTFIKKIPDSTVITWSMYAPAQLLFALSCFD